MWIESTISIVDSIVVRSLASIPFSYFFHSNIIQKGQSGCTISLYFITSIISVCSTKGSSIKLRIRFNEVWGADMPGFHGSTSNDRVTSFPFGKLLLVEQNVVKYFNSDKRVYTG